MAAVDDLETALIAAAEAGTGKADADAARAAICSAQAIAFKAYIDTVVGGSTVNTTVIGTLPSGPPAATGSGTVTLAT